MKVVGGREIYLEDVVRFKGRYVLVIRGNVRGIRM